MPMPPSLQEADVALRLGLAVVVGVLIGFNRSEHGKVAGMRTMVLVCLAAAVAMIQVNVLLPMAGRPAASFVMNDLMRLPLGILTGVGFIGAGAILRRGDMVVGVTTAATLWLVTVIGLCIGGGQIELGLAATALGLFALWILKWIERSLKRQFRSRLSIELEEGGPEERELRRMLVAAGLEIEESSLGWDRARRRRTVVFGVLETGRESQTGTPAIVGTLADEPGVTRLHWSRRP